MADLHGYAETFTCPMLRVVVPLPRGRTSRELLCIPVRQLDGRVLPRRRRGKPHWPAAVSVGTFNSFIINGATGATNLQLPFVNSSIVGPIDIIRRNNLPIPRSWPIRASTGG